MCLWFPTNFRILRHTWLVKFEVSNLWIRFPGQTFSKILHTLLLLSLLVYLRFPALNINQLTKKITKFRPAFRHSLSQTSPSPYIILLMVLYFLPIITISFVSISSLRCVRTSSSFIVGSSL
jgi:hypothetical protein